MKILVTGAGGFIGKNLVDDLARRHEVKSLVYREESSSTDFLEKSGSEVFPADVTEKSSLKNHFKGREVVINLAAQRRGWETTQSTSYEVNVEGTRNVIEESVKNNVEHFIHCSTSSIIGPVKDKPLDEDFRRRNTSKTYYRTKLQADRLVTSFENKINTTIILPPLVYGPHDYHHLPIFKAVRDNKMHFIGGGENIFHPTYVEDCIEGFKLSMKNEKAYGERFIVGAEEYAKTQDIIYAIAEEMGAEITPLNIPKPLAKCACQLLEPLGEFLGFKPPLNQRVLDWFTENHFFDISKAKRILEFEPEYELKKGISKTVDWYFNNGWL